VRIAAAPLSLGPGGQMAEVTEGRRPSLQQMQQQQGGCMRRNHGVFRNDRKALPVHSRWKHPLKMYASVGSAGMLQQLTAAAGLYCCRCVEDMA